MLSAGTVLDTVTRQQHSAKAFMAIGQVTSHGDLGKYLQERGFPGCSERTQHDDRIFIKGEHGYQGHRRMRRDKGVGVMHFESGGRGHEPRNVSLS